MKIWKTNNTKETISRKRLFACALANTPPEVRVVCLRRGINGLAEPGKGRLSAPRPVTRVALQIFLHELAHFVLHSPGHDYKPRYYEEYEAERWSFQRMREALISVPNAAARIARRNVARAILRAMRNDVVGIPIDMRAARFAWGSHARAWLSHIEKSLKINRLGDVYFWNPLITPVTAGPPPKEPYASPLPPEPPEPEPLPESVLALLERLRLRKKHEED
jgi:hypothetical protein